MNQLPNESLEKKPSRLLQFFFLETTFALLLTVILIVGGLIAYQSMVKESNPDIDIPNATIKVIAPGMDALSVEKNVTNVLEDQIKTLKGLKKLRSSSFDNMVMFAVEFDSDLDTAEAVQRLRNKVAEAASGLPKGVHEPVVIQKTVDDKPILSITVYGDVNAALMGRTVSKLRDQIQRVSGVREVNLAGKREEEIAIKLIKSRLETLKISTLEIRDAIQSANKNTSWGRIEGGFHDTAFRLEGQFTELDQIKNIPVKKMESGNLIYLRDVADVSRVLKKEKVRSFFSVGGGEFTRCIDVSIIKSSGADTVNTIAGIKDQLALFRVSDDWPSELKIAFTTDQSIEIMNDLNDVLANGWQAMLAVFLVLLVMLSWREAVIAATCIPITFLGGLLVVWMTGGTLNSLVIIGMVLALGMLVDVFILMMEGMHQQIYINKVPYHVAAIRTIKMYAGPAFAGQMTTILAMAPLMVIAGFQGKFIRIIPSTSIVCLIVSFGLAFLASIPLSSFLLKKVDADAPLSKVDKVSHAYSEKLERFTLGLFLKNRKASAVSVLAAGGIFVFSVYLASGLPSELYPAEDSRDLAITLKLPPNATLEDSQRLSDAVGAVLRGVPELENTVQFVGQKSPNALGSMMSSLEISNAQYISGFTCRFTAASERDVASYVTIGAIRPVLEEVIGRFPGASIRYAYSMGGGSTDDPLQIVFYGDDLVKLGSISKKTQALLKGNSGTMAVRDSVGPIQYELSAVPNLEALSFYKVNQSALSDQLSFVTGPQKVGVYRLAGAEDNIDIKLSTAWASRGGDLGGPQSAEEFKSLHVLNQDKVLIPLVGLVDFKIKPTATLINHQAGRRSLTVMCKTDGATVSEIFKTVLPELDRMKDTWPGGYAYAIGGEAEDAAETFGSAAVMMVVAVFMVFALLLIQFNSLSQPLIIMMTVPLALTGTLLGFYAIEMAFSFPAMIGIIALVGIVVNNAIVMIDNINHHLGEGLSVRLAAAKGSAERLRPILSTTITTLVGLIPLALSSAQWMPLCAAIIFGLLAGTVSAFIVVPAAFYVVNKDGKQIESGA